MPQTFNERLDKKLPRWRNLSTAEIIFFGLAIGIGIPLLIGAMALLIGVTIET